MTLKVQPRAKVTRLVAGRDPGRCTMSDPGRRLTDRQREIIERNARTAATTAAGLRHVDPAGREEVYQAAYARVTVYLTLAVIEALETGGGAP